MIEVAGDVPVLVRGGGRVDDRTLLERTAAVLAQGARGIVYGRNVVQHENPTGITPALMAVLHDDAVVDGALRLAMRPEPVEGRASTSAVLSSSKGSALIGEAQ